MGRLIVGLIVGMLAGGLTVGIVESIGHVIFPPPPGLDASNPETLKVLMEQIPLGAKIAVVVAWALGILLGGSVGAFIAKRGPELLLAANQRYLEFISQLDEPTSGNRVLEKVTETVIDHGRSYKGFNFFNDIDLRLMLAVLRGEHTISGLRNKDLLRFLPDQSSGAISRLLKRFRVHGLIKRVGHTYKYYVTALGRAALVAGLKLKELFLVPVLAAASIS